jgi:hypothetical protein
MDPDQTIALLFLFFPWVVSWGKDPDRFRPLLRLLGVLLLLGVVVVAVVVAGERRIALVSEPTISLIGRESDRFRPFRPLEEEWEEEEEEEDNMIGGILLLWSS